MQWRGKQWRLFLHPRTRSQGAGRLQSGGPAEGDVGDGWLADEKVGDVSLPKPDGQMEEHDAAMAGGHSDAIQGTVQIKDNRISVSDPQAGGSYAVLWIPVDERVEILVDGLVSTGEVVVNSDVTIEVVTYPQAAHADIDVQVCADELEVSIEVLSRPGVTYHLEEAPPARKVAVRVVETFVPAPPVSAQEMRALLSQRGFQGVIDEASLEALCEGATGRGVVLRGTRPVAGRPVRFSPEPAYVAYDPLQRRMRMTVVKPGHIVGRVLEALPGAPGLSVWGRVIEAPTVGCAPQLGRGIIRVGEHLVAAQGGRLLHTERFWDVVPELVISHNVTPYDGQIVFHGDVVVRGHVLDGSLIKATGSVTVYGGIFGGVIIAEQGLYSTDNVVRSKLLIGQRHTLYAGTVLPITRVLKAALTNFYEDYATVLEVALQRKTSARRIARLAHALIEQRHEDLSTGLAQLIALDGEPLLGMDARYRELSEYVRSKWQGVQRTNLGPDDIRRLQALVTLYDEYLKEYIDMGPANVRVASLASSVVRASGHVTVYDTGVFASHVECGGSIIIHGFVRGGALGAQHSIRAHEVGTSLGVETGMHVRDAQGYIAIEIRHPGTLLDVGGKREKNLGVQTKVRYSGRTA